MSRVCLDTRPCRGVRTPRAPFWNQAGRRTMGRRRSHDTRAWCAPGFRGAARTCAESLEVDHCGAARGSGAGGSDSASSMNLRRERRRSARARRRRPQRGEGPPPGPGSPGGLRSARCGHRPAGPPRPRVPGPEGEEVDHLQRPEPQRSEKAPSSSRATVHGVHALELERYLEHALGREPKRSGVDFRRTAAPRESNPTPGAADPTRARGALVLGPSLRHPIVAFSVDPPLLMAG